MIIILPLSIFLLFISLIHTDVDWDTGVPRRYVVFAVEFIFFCESPSRGRRRRVGRTGPQTRQQRVFECVPWGCCDDPRSFVRIHKSHSTAALITSLFVSSVSFLMLKVQTCICIRQPRIYSFVSNVVNNTVCALVFTHQSMIKEKSADVLFLSTFCDCTFFLYLWCCISDVYTLSCPSHQGRIILMY